MIKNKPWSIWTEGKKIIKDLTTELYDLVHSVGAREYWCKKDGLTEEAINTVNWDIIGTAMKEVNRSRRVFITKHVCGMCGVGKFMARWNCALPVIVQDVEHWKMPLTFGNAMGRGATIFGNDLWPVWKAGSAT